jgi:hypothetical protein
LPATARTVRTLTRGFSHLKPAGGRPPPISPGVPPQIPKPIHRFPDDLPHFPEGFPRFPEPIHRFPEGIHQFPEHFHRFPRRFHRFPDDLPPFFGAKTFGNGLFSRGLDGIPTGGPQNGQILDAGRSAAATPLWEGKSTTKHTNDTKRNIAKSFEYLVYFVVSPKTVRRLCALFARPAFQN